MKAKSMRHHRRIRIRLDSQPGQAIVLIVMMMVMLLGIVAVAIDGGGLLFLRRDAQNAADAGALSGVRALCNSDIPHTDRPNEARTRATASAADNGFTTGLNQSQFQNVLVTAETPASTAVLPAGADANEYVRVMVDAEKVTYFARFVFNRPLTVHAEAMARCVDGEPPDELAAIVGLRACNSACITSPGGGANNADVVDFSGSEVVIEGGLHSNCHCNLIGNAGNSANSTIEGETTCSGIMSQDVGITYNPGPPEQNADEIDNPLANIFPVEAFAPGGYYAELAASDECLADTVLATDGGSCYHVLDTPQKKPNNSNSHVYEGLYYLPGGFQTAGTITVGPKGATFVSPDGALNFPKLNGVFPYQRAGFMFAASYLNDNDMCSTVITGPNSNDARWSGVIYAPYGECRFSLASGTTYGSIVCQKVDISGSDFTLIYQPIIVPEVPAYTQLIR